MWQECSIYPRAIPARFVIGAQLAAGRIPAIYVVDDPKPFAGQRFSLPAHYWSSDSASATMKGGFLDGAVLSLGPNFSAHVIVAPEQVAAALGFPLVSPEETGDVPPPPPMGQPGPSATAGERRQWRKPRWDPLTEALLELQKEGLDIQSPVSIDELHQSAEKKAGIKAGKRTFERARKEALRREH